MADQNATDEAVAAPVWSPSGCTLPAGNKLFDQALIRKGYLGFWYPPHGTSDPEPWAEIVPEVFRRSVHATTAGVLRRLAQNASGSSSGGGWSRQAVTDAKIDGAARYITDAVCMAAYLKIRSVNRAIDPMAICNNPSPRVGVPEPFEIPQPFAAVLSHLGAVEVRDLPRRMVAVPTVPADATATFQLERGPAWDLHAYAGAAAFARSLRMQFAAVAPRASGTAWWLLQGRVDDGDRGGGEFSLRCVLPETNYTVQDAVAHSMFCLDERLRFGAALFRLDAGVAQGDYGSMLRNPHAGMNVNTFLALSDEPLRSMCKIE